MIKCAQCGFDNPFGHLYCTKCKSRLNLSQITRESFLSSGQHGDYHRKILECVLLVIILCLGLALWPAQLGELKTSSLDFNNARNKLNQLQKGVAVSPVEFSEKEVNLLFNHLIQQGRRSPDFKAESGSIYAGRVTINPKTLTVCLRYQIGPWLLDPVAIGPFALTYKITGRPEKTPDGLRLRVLNSAIGHLPLPLLGRNFGTVRLQQLFLPFKNARVFLSRLEVIEMRKGSITVFGAQ